MKKIILGAGLLLMSILGMSAQTIGNEAVYQLEDGFLDIKLGNGDQRIRFGGYIQANAFYQDVRNAETKKDYGFDVNYARLSVEGSFLKNKLGFVLQTDFTDSYPLLDAYVSYNPLNDYLKLTVGQKQNIADSRQMLFSTPGLAFGGVSAMTKAFNGNGRELGIYLESRIPAGKTGFDLGFSLTSGDGRNSFGASSTDPDKGGLKSGARVSFYPMGFFRKGNESFFNDFVREKTPKLAIGAAFSYNAGVSNKVGEGHGDFVFYGADGSVNYPDYRKFDADLLFKWSGFTFLAEYHNASATKLNNIYLASTGTGKLMPRQIADYLALGNGVNIQAGYLTRNLWVVNAGWNKVLPEWDETETSVLRDMDCYDLSFGKYFHNNTFKIELVGRYLNYGKTTLPQRDQLSFRLFFHILF